jgi:signal transduction histidine kinase
MSYLEKALNTGVTADMSKLQSRGIILSNTIALFAVFISVIYFIYALSNGWSFVDTVVVLVIVTLSSVLVLNKLGSITISRGILSIIIPVAAMLAILLPRFQDPEKYAYIRSPGIFPLLLATSVFPALIFSRSERKLMIFCQCMHFLLYASHDLWLRWFSSSHTLPTIGRYFESNLVLILAYILLIGCVWSLKNIVDDFDRRNELLISDLNENNKALERNNRELHELNKNIETQNEEIQAQSEELRQSQESLIIANNHIELQKRDLEKSLDEKSRDLLFTNQQLVTQNNELQQFSYTVSHNLRGPVASILGLINIHRLAVSEEEKAHTISLLETSALSLENIILDLNRIIDIRYDKFGAYELVSFDQELLLIKQSLTSFLDKNKVSIEERFTHKEIKSIKAYVNSILYNLISNAIQYRSPDRDPVIRVSSQLSYDGYVIVEVADNGLGIDLSRFQSDLFKLYKRFHASTPGGKGLGLYLIKQQVEKLNGRIEVESQPGVGSTFRVLIPVKG